MENKEEENKEEKCFLQSFLKAFVEALEREITAGTNKLRIINLNSIKRNHIFSHQMAFQKGFLKSKTVLVEVLKKIDPRLFSFQTMGEVEYLLGYNPRSKLESEKSKGKARENRG